jgi:hypothetical protein
VVTESKGKTIMKVNDRPVLDYLNSLGVEKIIERGIITSLSLVINDTPDSQSYLRAMNSLDEDHNLVCSGDIINGSIIRVGVYEKKDMLEESRKCIRAAINTIKDKEAFALIYSCATRYVVLAADSLAEFNIFRKEAGEKPYLVAYAGGEICPVRNSSGQLTNRFRNQNLVICII